MVGWILKKILGSKNQREIKRLTPIVRRINEFDEQFKSAIRRRPSREDSRVEGRNSPRFQTYRINGRSSMRFCRKHLRW